MALIEAKFKLEKETKGAVRYQEVDEKGEPEHMSAKDWIALLAKDRTRTRSGSSASLRVIVEVLEP